MRDERIVVYILKIQKSSMSKLKKIRNFFALERNVIVICVSNIILFSGFSLWNNFLPKFFGALGASAIIVGFLFSLESGLQTFFHILGGYFSDRYGRKRIFVLSTVLSAVALLVYYVSPF